MCGPPCTVSSWWHKRQERVGDPALPRQGGGALPVPEREFYLPAWPEGLSVSTQMQEADRESESEVSSCSSSSDSDEGQETQMPMSNSAPSVPEREERKKGASRVKPRVEVDVLLINDDTFVFHPALQDSEWPGGYAPLCKNAHARIRPLRLLADWPIEAQPCGHPACRKVLG